MVINGAGADQTKIVGDASFGDRILETSAPNDPPTYVISNVTIDSGQEAGAFSESNGGGILNDSANLTLHNVVLHANRTSSNGGGLYSAGVDGSILTIDHTTLDSNFAFDGGGMFIVGSTSGANQFSNLYVTNNIAHDGAQIDGGGGGIYNELGGTGSTAFTDLMVIGNGASGMNGGGVYDESGFATFAQDTYTNVTLANNAAVTNGGGMYVFVGFATLINATVTGNTLSASSQTAGDGDGAGLAIGRNGRLTVQNATINANTSTQGAGAGIGLVQGNDQLSLHNTIVTNNKSNGSVNNCFFGGTPVIHDLGYNLSDDSTCNLVAAGDHQGAGVNPNLGALNDNGGPADGAPGSTFPTKTEALPQGSSAIDAGDPNSANNPSTDERHVSRPRGAASDVGAYEFVPPLNSPTPGLPPAGTNLSSQAPGMMIPAYLLVAGACFVAGIAAVGSRRRRRI